MEYLEVVIPATAGTVLTEERLRAFLKCSQFYHYGGVEKPHTKAMMAQYALEAWMALSLRDRRSDRALRITKAIMRATKDSGIGNDYLSQQVQKMQRETTLWLDSFLKIFKEDMYFPVTGPLPYRVVCSKTPIELRMSGIMRTAKNKTLHVISFSPHNDVHSQINDPITHLKLHALKSFVPKAKRPQAMLHMLWSTKQGELGYNNIDSNQLSPEYLQMIESKIQEIENGRHFPVLPCLYDCKFKKSKCRPEKAEKT